MTTPTHLYGGATLQTRPGDQHAGERNTRNGEGRQRMSTPTTRAATSGELAPNYFLHTFDNGLQIVGQRMPSLGSVTFGIQFAAGIKDEPEERLGLTNLLAEMLFQGTEHRTVRQLTEDFEAIGARKRGATPAEPARYSAPIVDTRVD